MIQEAVGGNYRTDPINGTEYSKLTLTGKSAEMVLNRIKKHLVIKRHYANACLDLLGNWDLVKNRPVEEHKQYLKEQRKIRSLPLPNFPSRRWLAGYFDGDGCLYACLSKRGVVTMAFSIASSSFDTEGIEIIQKVFGGVIKPMSQGNNVQHLIVWIAPSKAERILGYFSRHLITKKDQVDFILGCARMGHYRDGKHIHTALKQLKAHPHRLNEPEADIPKILSTIEDREWSYYRKQDRLMRQSEYSSINCVSA